MQYQFRMAVIQKKRKRNKASDGENVEKLGPLHIADGNVRWCTAVENGS